MGDADAAVEAVVHAAVTAGSVFVVVDAAAVVVVEGDVERCHVIGCR